MIKKKIKRIYLVFVIFPLLSFSQAHFTDNLYLESNYHFGLLIPEYKNLIYLANDYIRSASINISKKTIGKNDWEQSYNFPEAGVSLFYSTLANKKVHGSEIAVFPYFNIYYASKSKVTLYQQVGLGLSYVTKKFDLKENYQNIAVGSHFNIHFSTKIAALIPLTKKAFLNAGIAFDHFSNANLKEPNLGLNYVTLLLGFKYLIGEEVKPEIQILPAHQKHNYCEVFASAGGKYTRALQSDFYETFSTSFSYKWAFKKIFHFGSGVDFFYDSSTETEMTITNPGKYKRIDDYKTGLSISQQLLYNKFSIILQEGVYVGLTDKIKNRPVYTRGIVRYCFANKFIFQIAMKSHLHVLDYPELGFGYKW